jgi:hypothetical protein
MLQERITKPRETYAQHLLRNFKALPEAERHTREAVHFERIAAGARQNGEIGVALHCEAAAREYRRLAAKAGA